MELKKCFKCNETKPLSEFYKHDQMHCGRLGKCKECTKRDSEANRQRKMLDPNWVLKERERCREKARRQIREGRAIKPSKESKRETNRKYAANNPEKRRAQGMVNEAIRRGRMQKKPCEVCANQKSEAHHDDYSKPLEVRWLCAKHHGGHHAKLRDLEILNSK